MLPQSADAAGCESGECAEVTCSIAKPRTEERDVTPDARGTRPLEISFRYEPIAGRLTEVQVELLLEYRTRRLAKRPERPIRTTL